MTFRQLALSDVASLRMGSPAPQGDQYFSDEGMPFVRVQDVGRVGHTLSLTTTKDRINDRAITELRPAFARKGTIVFPKSGAAISTNSRAILGVDAYVVSHLAMVEALPDVIDTAWLYYYLCTVDMGQFSRTAALPSLRLSELAELSIPVPELSEQRRMVSRIKACMERVDEIDRDATEASREIDAVFPAFLNERFAEILASCQPQALEQVADIRGGGSLPKGAPIDQGDEAVLLVKVGDMNIEGNDRVIGVAREFLPRNEAGRNTIPSGAVVLPKRGGAIATNKKRMLGRPALIDPNLMAIVARPDVISAEYLYYWSLTLDLAALSNGGVIPQLNRKDLAPLQVPIPLADVQQEIVESLKRAETYCGQLRAEFDAAQAERVQLRESILRKAFAGEL